MFNNKIKVVILSVAKNLFEGDPSAFSLRMTIIKNAIQQTPIIIVDLNEDFTV